MSRIVKSFMQPRNEFSQPKKLLVQTPIRASGRDKGDTNFVVMVDGCLQQYHVTHVALKNLNY